MPCEIHKEKFSQLKLDAMIRTRFWKAVMLLLLIVLIEGTYLYLARYIRKMFLNWGKPFIR